MHVLLEYSTGLQFSEQFISTLLPLPEIHCGSDDREFTVNALIQLQDKLVS